MIIIHNISLFKFFFVENQHLILSGTHLTVMRSLEKGCHKKQESMRIFCFCGIIEMSAASEKVIQGKLARAGYAGITATRMGVYCLQLLQLRQTAVVAGLVDKLLGLIKVIGGLVRFVLLLQTSFPAADRQSVYNLPGFALPESARG